MRILKSAAWMAAALLCAHVSAIAQPHVSGCGSGWEQLPCGPIGSGRWLVNSRLRVTGTIPAMARV